MSFTQIVMFYFCTVICVLYLVSGDYKVIRTYVRKKIDDAATTKVTARQTPTRSDSNSNT